MSARGELEKVSNALGNYVFHTDLKTSLHSALVESSYIMRICTLYNKYIWFMGEGMSHSRVFMLATERGFLFGSQKPGFRGLAGV